MAKCKDCEQFIAPSARRCPNCGSEDPSGGNAIASLILLVIVLGVGALALTGGLF